MNKENIIISNNIKMHRKISGLLQSEVARKLGISVRKYNSIENNPFKYSLEELKVISDFYGCNFIDFFMNLKDTKSGE